MQIYEDVEDFDPKRRDDSDPNRDAGGANRDAGDANRDAGANRDVGDNDCDGCNESLNPKMVETPRQRVTVREGKLSQDNTTLSITALSITALSITTLSMTHSAK